MNKKTLILFFLVIAIGAFLRLWQIGKVPISPDWDEVSLGYNAYSIIHTGRDEYGEFLPIVMRSFDDYKPALYSYLSIPTILLFGLNVFAVRLPSAIFGILTIISVYFLLRELFREKKLKLEFLGFVLDVPMVSAFLLAISPWHIQFSRIAFEANVGLSFNILAALCFLKGLKNPWFLTLSAIFATFSIYTYQSEKVFTPLFIAALVIIYRKELFLKSKKYMLLAVTIGLVLVLPMLIFTVGNKNALQRAQGVSIFADSNSLLSQGTQRLLIDKQKNDLIGLIVDNRRVIFAKEVVSGYISHFDLNWLFIKGDIARHHAPNVGLLYLFELPFLLVGVYMLVFGPLDKKTKLFIFTWFLLAPIPASVTSGVPHAIRTLNFLPTFQIFTAIGILASLNFILSIKYKVLSIKSTKLFVIGYLLFAVFNFIYYLNQYFVQQNYFNANQWQYGYEKIVPQVQNILEKYKKIVVSNQAPMDQSYMFFLFYLNYPPGLYQKESIDASGGFRENHTFGRFEFRPIDWIEDQKLGNTLFVGRSNDFSDNANILLINNYPDGSVSMKVAEAK